ncbi:MAG: GNAT family N-acetyltransferase [Chloroflexota bacterium]
MPMLTPELNRPACLGLADALGESPETVMSIHRLRRGLARAWAAGDPVAAPAAAVVQGTLLPDEPHVFGEDAAAIAALLREVPGWVCVNAPAAVAPALARIIERDTGRPCALGPEVYLTLPEPEPAAATAAAAQHGPAPARLLGPADLPLLEAATIPLGMAGWRFGDAARLLAEGIAAGAAEGEDLLAVAFTSALGERFAEIGVVTREDARGRGLAGAGAAIVRDALLAAGVAPVWSTSADNAASLRVAARLGFREVSRRVYVCRG